MVEAPSNIMQNISLTKVLETKNTVQLPKISPEIKVMFKTESLVDLNLFLDSDGHWRAVLESQNQTFPIPIDTKVAETLADGENQITIPVRVLENGQLVAPKEVPSSVTDIRSDSALQKTAQQVLSKIDVEPLKIEDFIRTSLQEMNTPQVVAKTIVENFLPLQVSIQNVGQTTEADSFFKPLLQQFLTQVVTQDVVQIPEQIKNFVENITGSVLTGKVTNQVKDTTWLTTSLGKTFFESKIKLPIEENVILNIRGMTKDYAAEFKFLDNIIKTVLPSKEISIHPEQISSDPQLKSLSDIASYLSEKSFSQIVGKLPMTSNNLLQNIYNFYQAAENKDVTKWIGERTLRDIQVDTKEYPKVIQELQNFVTGSAKETPLWKIVEMPLFDGTQFSNLKIAVKKDTEEKLPQNTKAKKGIRFVVETNFSQLGAFQFDGFSNEKERKLDLIIRTDRFQDDDLCSNIINLFKKTLYDVGYVGTIKINRRETFIKLMEDSKQTEGMYI